MMRTNKEQNGEKRSHIRKGQIIIKILLVMTVLIRSGNSESMCDTEKCTGPYQIEVPTIPTPKARWESIKAEIYCTEKVEVDSILAIKEKYHRYCYNGGNIDPNTGCYMGHHFYSLEFEEIIKWKNEGFCYTGPECKIHGNCWGSESRKCLVNDKENPSFSNLEKVALPGKDGKLSPIPWMLFPWHTCELSWGCSLHPSKIPVFLHLNKETNTVKPYIIDNEHRRIFLKDHPAVYHGRGDQWHIAILESVLIKSYRKELHCVDVKDGKPYYCILPDDSELAENANIVVEIKEGVGAERNCLVSVEPEIFKGNDYFQDGSASIADVEQLRETTTFLVKMIQHDVLALMKTMQTMMRVNTKMINSLAKMDDRLIGNIINNQIKTTWFNEKLFKICPCYRLKKAKHSNCYEDYIFKDGRYILNKDFSKCVSIGDSLIQNMTIFNISTPFMFEMNIPPPEGSSNSWDGWSWLAEKKQKIIDSMLYAEESSNPESSISQFFSEGFSSIFGWGIFTKISGFIGWIAFFMALIALCRR
uniref:Hemagglutinin n=1 Tax=Beihai orthomyxo-like virus 1 TaxID=1922494 RepID=A0A1L3KKC3_9VIRU|nr:hemagglutinin [Beihai orthomyxo-like virus 1]